MIADKGVRLVYGGGTKGIMGAVAQSVHENEGQVTGIIPRFLLNSEAAHEPEKYCSEVVVTDTMHERKHEMFERSDAFIALPGGIGTLEELVEIMTWAQLGRHTKPIAVLNTDDFWRPLINLYAHMEDAGFIHSSKRVSLNIIENMDQLSKFLSKTE